MAKAGAKNRVIANAKRVKLLKLIILTANVLHVTLKLILFRQSRTLQSWLGFGLTSLIYVVCYSGIASMAEPTYGANGELLDGGSDLNMGGLCTYYHDLIYLAAIVQIGTIFSSRFWMAFLVVPLYAAYQLWVNIVKPYFLAPRPQSVAQEETPAEKKKREKLERKQNRVRYR
ncbi:DUF788-domain-containing protein [Coccomyxa subellipsoidea C-169]|uniref:DUF788-domain-containing protein n=1 Tax=Coccomyxa subellipsoidea (strain C-169) TaxID=574566 RepID=I0Z061_COCSC|nr:DUF788-domain-containing protein [Coccomyxa subellipsoidea C-169]EIE24030.1 DUF788-domain-containing protein [Coccomyxa subellipsoidea C-169]|eukprot:XP_005648574.1 DUF788-domain-containing protein [Coccomyxa subellipsoidea C-169]